MNLAFRTAKAAVVGLLVLGAIVFVPAGTLAYWQGWTLAVVFTASAVSPSGFDRGDALLASLPPLQRRQRDALTACQKPS